jgi:hypothetical protein
MKNNQALSIDSAMEKLEVLNTDSSKNVIGGKIKIIVRIIAD